MIELAQCVLYSEVPQLFIPFFWMGAWTGLVPFTTTFFFSFGEDVGLAGVGGVSEDSLLLVDILFFEDFFLSAILIISWVIGFE